MNWHHAVETYRGHTIPHFKLVEHRRWWFMFSGVLIVLSLIGLFWRGLNYSIDFEGGAQIAYPLQVQDVTVADIVDTMAQFGRPDAEVQIVNGDQVSIRTASLTGDPQTEGLGDALAKQAGITTHRHQRSRTSARPGAPRSRGRRFTGLIAVLIAIALYIAFRFEWKMAIGAMIALVHDVVITAGIYALVGREVTPETVIAILTILGYLALRHRRDLRQDQGEHRVERARLPPGLHGRGRPLVEPGADALGEHVAGRAAADPVAAAVRRRHPEGLRVRDVRRASRSAPTPRSSSPRPCSRS